jgi:hypothetical protein
MAGHARLRYRLAMSTSDNVTLCDPCRNLLLQPAPVKPHKFMSLVDVRPPEAYGDVIERRYSCVECGTSWLRTTTEAGCDMVFLPLQWLA